MISVLNQISDASGNAKLDVMQSLEGYAADTFKRVAQLAYHPTHTYDIRLPDYEDLQPLLVGRSNGSRISLVDAMNELENNFMHQPANNARKEDILDMLACLYEGDAEVMVRLINRDLRIGCGVSSINKVFPGLISTFELMACQGLNEKTAKLVQPGWLSQLKYDAARISIKVTKTKIVYMTRNGRVYNIYNDTLNTGLFKMRDRVDYDFMLDGEIFQWCRDGKMASRKISNGVANKFIKDTAEVTDHANIGIAVWDMIPVRVFNDHMDKMNKPYAVRLAELYTSITDIGIANRIIKAAESTVINSLEDAQEIGQKFIADGFEGSIIKDPDALWEPKRSKGALKIKAIREADLRVIELVEGTGRLKGRLGAAICESECGMIRVSVGSGFKDDERDLDQDLVGKIISVLYNEIILAKGSTVHSLFLPRLSEVRFDKTEADTYEKIMLEY